MDAQDIKRLIMDRAQRFGYRNAQEFQFLCERLEKIDQTIVLDGLLAVFLEDVSSQGGVEQELAGQLLFKLKPSGQVDILSFLRGALRKYELSVEELPLYLCELVGEKNLLEILSNLRLELIDDTEIRALEAMRFWLRAIKKV